MARISLSSSICMCVGLGDWMIHSIPDAQVHDSEGGECLVLAYLNYSLISSLSSLPDWVEKRRKKLLNSL